MPDSDTRHDSVQGHTPGDWTDRLRSLCGEQCAQFGEPPCGAVVNDAPPCSRCLLIDALSVFLGHDERFTVAVGGNPRAVDEMMTTARYAYEYATNADPYRAIVRGGR